MAPLTVGPSPAAGAAALHQIRTLLGANRTMEACSLAEQLLAGRTGWAEGQHLLGVARAAAGDTKGAEAAFIAALHVDLHCIDAHVSLAEVLARRGDDADAERAFNRALAIEPSHQGAALGLAGLLLRHGRPDAAVEATAEAAATPQASHATLAIHARALKMARRREEALDTYRRAARLYPTSGLAEHNVASMLGDLGRFPEAESAALRARAKGLDAAETWLVLGRALMNQNKFDAAGAAFSEALRRRPDYLEAHRDRAQLVWMRTGDIRAATDALDSALADPVVAPELLVLKADLLSNAGEVEAAYDLLERPARQAPERTVVSLTAAHLAALIGQPEAALAHAEAAARWARDDPAVLLGLCEAHLALGDAQSAERLANQLSRIRPHDQAAIAYRLTAWRLSGDERYQASVDYGRLTSTELLDTPSGWTTLDDYLSDLEAALEARHAFKTHPLGQSVRHGSQISHLNASSEPVIKAFFKAVDGPIRRFLARTSGGSDPMSSRSAGGGYGFEGTWSVQLRAGGFHRGHIHPDGWISSACYIALPDVTGDERPGWLQFGEPGVPTRPELPPDYFVEPRRGLVALFPAYLWHGTRPFAGERPRLTVAFDLKPAAFGSAAGP